MRKRKDRGRSRTPYFGRVPEAETKAFAIDAKGFGIFSEVAGVTADDPTTLARQIAQEHEIFEVSAGLSELENFSHQTAVGIGFIKEGRKNLYPLVDNRNKSGLGFPGGKVRPGEAPISALSREIPEETGLVCEVIEPAVSEVLVGEDEHQFTAYRVRFSGGNIRVPKFNKHEPIIDVPLVEESTLRKACETGGQIEINGRCRPVLPNHRRAGMDYFTILDAEKAAKAPARKPARKKEARNE